jgi:hypothetical protein
MGFLWDLVQQSQIGEQRSKAASMEERIARVENDLHETRELLAKLLHRLESHLGEDIDENGSVG